MRVLAVTNMYPTPDAPASGAFVERQVAGLRAAGVDLTLLFIDRRGGGVLEYLHVGARLVRAVGQVQPGLVHVMYGGVLARLVTRAVVDRPVIVSFCGTDLLGGSAGGPVRRLMSACGVRASRRAACEAAGIIVKSRNLGAALPAGIDSSRVRIIPNGVDLKRFRPLDRAECRRRLGWAEGTFHVVFPTSSGDPVKRFGLASAAVRALARTGLDVELHQLRGVAHADVPIWLNAGDVVLLTSAQEGSPNAVKEALACRVPVVAVDVGDVRERIQDVQGCYLARPEAADLAEALRRVVAGPRRTIGRTGIEEISLESISRRLKAFYAEIVADVGRPGREPRPGAPCGAENQLEPPVDDTIRTLVGGAGGAGVPATGNS